MRKQTNPFAVRLVVFTSGERLPLLCRRSTGTPLFEPTVYAITELRAQNRASATIQQALRAVMVLYLVLERLKIDLDQRLGEGVGAACPSRRSQGTRSDLHRLRGS
jgi:hypothetical protein